ncbi:MAG: hypothetical protein GX031_10310, partial [Candidatus Riflebacteria bacterium]|nr:hypothetical protein [Candidatus Riflebacteria bacterium]
MKTHRKHIYYPIDRTKTLQQTLLDISKIVFNTETTISKLKGNKHITKEHFFVYNSGTTERKTTFVANVNNFNFTFKDGYSNVSSIIYADRLEARYYLYTENLYYYGQNRKTITIPIKKEN